METLKLPLPRSRSKLTERKPFNLYLRTTVGNKAAVLAEQRYGYSLSELVDRLLEREMTLKKGLLGNR